MTHQPPAGWRARFRAALLPLLVTVLAVLTAWPAFAGVRSGRGGFGPGARPPAQDDAYLFHVLSRVTYGATEENWARIRAIGPDAFIAEQLDPLSMDDSALEARLATDSLPQDDPLYEWDHFYHDHVARAVSSQRQLQEVMVQFWENHFDTVVDRGNNEIQRHFWTELELWENNYFRDNAFGSFRDLLEWSSKSGAMLFFLNNIRNTAEEGNENYARELMELHSLGVDCGYSQHDVEEVARIWTGWTHADLTRQVPGVDPRDELFDLDMDGRTDYVYQPRLHDAAPKDTLGRSFSGADGRLEGEIVLDILAAHPCTARFISSKLIEKFVTDRATDEYVDRIASVFMQTDGDITRVLEAIFESPEFRDPANFGGKIRTPFEFTVAALRGTNADFDTTGGGYALYETWWRVYEMGMALFDMPIPTGYDEDGPLWLSANGFLQRWKYASELTLWQAGRPTYTDPMADVLRLGLSTTDEVINHYTGLLLGRKVDDERRALLAEVLLQGRPAFDTGDASQATRLREMVGNILGMPEFNQQ